jgi:protein-S-isoprenylcysteine O-methyltransferase Ste14
MIGGDSSMMTNTLDAAPFSLDEVGPSEACPELSNGDSWYSARLSRRNHAGKDWVIKDFSQKGWLCRQTLGRFYTWNEHRALQRLGGLATTPPNVFKLSPYALCYEFSPGLNTRHARQQGLVLDGTFFSACAEAVARMHARHIVHLDLRNGDNIVRSDDGTPLLVDFQSSVNVRWLPSPLRRLLERVDLGGVYKHWSRLDPDSMPQEHAARVQSERRACRWWPFNKARCLTPIHTLFNHFATRKFLLRLRVPLALGALVLLFLNAGPRFFWAALAVSWLGEALQVWCFAALKKTKILAWRGPYAIVRNPMYIGRFFLLLGVILLLENLWIIAGFSLCYYFYMVNRVKREEATLKGVFGADYDEYCRRIGRFLPRRIAAEDLKQVPYFQMDLFLRNHAHWNLLGTAIAWFALTLCIFAR